MKAVDFIVDYLIRQGTTDAFGIPGGVVLDLMYAMDARGPAFTPHLTYHEQGAVFAACGYAQTGGRLGVAYATRGPGVTNMITGIADAYYDSIPLLVITGHSQIRKHSSMRAETDQEMDPLPLVSSITKYAGRVERAEDVCRELEKACRIALSDRKGPVLLDFNASVYRAEIDPVDTVSDVADGSQDDTAGAAVKEIGASLAGAHRPVLLIGNGVRQSGTVEQVKQLAEKMRIPVLSSRIAQDIMPASPLYFGEVGGHALRYSNFILSKADLLITLGNRMSFPVDSLSYRPLMEGMKTIRIDVDEAEFLREVPNSAVFHADLKTLLPRLAAQEWKYAGSEEWLSVCRQLKDALDQCDQGWPVSAVARLLRTAPSDAVVTGDVGNNEYWLAHGYAGAEISNRILYSKSFGTLGVSLGKAIGAHYASGSPVICFIGDQGFQFNIQELQFVASHGLPIQIVVLNNHASGMIRGREKKACQGKFLHTTLDSGYSVPDFKAIAEAYGLTYRVITPDDGPSAGLDADGGPGLIEIRIEDDVELAPTLPIGAPVQKMSPPLPEELYQSLDRL